MPKAMKRATPKKKAPAKSKKAKAVTPEVTAAETVDPELDENVDTTVFDEVDAAAEEASPAAPVEESEEDLGPAPDTNFEEPIPEDPDDKFEVPKAIPKVSAASVKPSPAKEKTPETLAPTPAETPKATPPESDKVSAASTLKLSRHFNSSGERSEDGKDELIDVKRFETFPATIGISLGMTCNLGEYESAKINVTVSVPCYTEEIEQAYKFAYKIADDRLAEEVDSVRAGLTGSEAPAATPAATTAAPAAPETPAAPVKMAVPKIKA